MGTKVTDVLDLYAQEIAHAQDAGHCLDDSTTVGEAKNMAIRDLAVKVRSLKNIHAYDVVAWQAAQRALQVKGEMLDRANRECDTLRERVAELEEALRAIDPARFDALEAARKGGR